MQTLKFDLQQFLGRSTDKIPVLTETLSLLSDGIWIAGGCLRRLMEGKDFYSSDVDFFFQSFDKLSSFATTLELNGFTKKSENEFNSIWLKDNKKYQLIHFRYFTSPEELIDSFDFTICQLATDGTNILIGELTLWDIARRRLVLHKLSYGVATVRRCLKYGAQGYTVCSGTIAAILEMVANEPALIQREVQYLD